MMSFPTNFRKHFCSLLSLLFLLISWMKLWIKAFKIKKISYCAYVLCLQSWSELVYIWLTDWLTDWPAWRRWWRPRCSWAAWEVPESPLSWCSSLSHPGWTPSRSARPVGNTWQPGRTCQIFSSERIEIFLNISKVGGRGKVKLMWWWWVVWDDFRP